MCRHERDQQSPLLVLSGRSLLRPAKSCVDADRAEIIRPARPSLSARSQAREASALSGLFLFSGGVMRVKPLLVGAALVALVASASPARAPSLHRRWSAAVAVSVGPVSRTMQVPLPLESAGAGSRTSGCAF